MASINRHAIEISSNTRTSSSSRLCGEDSEARCRRESRPTTNFVLRRPGADHYSSSSSRPGPTPPRVPPTTAGSRCEPSVSVPRPLSRSPVPADPRREAVAPCRPLPGGRLSALRVCVLAADKRRHYGAARGSSSRAIHRPSTSIGVHHCRSVRVYGAAESARRVGCDPRLREGSPALIVRLTSAVVRS